MAVGRIEPFQRDADWGLYVERLEQYFVVNGVKEEHKVPTLITVMGGESYELLVTLCTPEKPSCKRFGELVKIMRNHLQPKPSLLAERYKFRKRKQKPGESIAEYVAELRRLSKGCYFGDGLQESLRDQFVCGLYNDVIRQRLFTDEELSFDRAQRLAIAIEAAEVNSAVVEGREDRAFPKREMVECHAVQAQRAGQVGKAASGQFVSGGQAANRRYIGQGQSGGNRAAGRRGEGPSRQCTVCGRDHNAATCKFRDYVCRVCNQPGHLKRMCGRVWNKTGQPQANVFHNEVQSVTSDSSEEERTDAIPKCAFQIDSVLSDDRACINPFGVEPRGLASASARPAHSAHLCDGAEQMKVSDIVRACGPRVRSLWRFVRVGRRPPAAAKPADVNSLLCEDEEECFITVEYRIHHDRISFSLHEPSRGQTYKSVLRREVAADEERTTDRDRNTITDRTRKFHLRGKGKSPEGKSAGGGRRASLNKIKLRDDASDDISD